MASNRASSLCTYLGLSAVAIHCNRWPSGFSQLDPISTQLIQGLHRRLHRWLPCWSNSFFHFYLEPGPMRQEKTPVSASATKCEYNFLVCSCCAKATQTTGLVASCGILWHEASGDRGGTWNMKVLHAVMPLLCAQGAPTNLTCEIHSHTFSQFWRRIELEMLAAK